MRFKIIENSTTSNIEKNLIRKLKQLGFKYTFLEAGWRDSSGNLITDFPEDWEPSLGDVYSERDVRLFWDKDGEIEFSWDIDEFEKTFTIITLWAYANAEKGKATRVLESCLNEIPTDFTIQIKDNINRDYWYYIQEKYPNYEWEDIYESLN